MIIYLVTNKVNGKKYVGITSRTFKARKQQHLTTARSGKGFAIHNAIRKYGEDNFIWKVIEESETWDELTEKEIKYIDEFDSFYNGYNLTLGGEGQLGGGLSGEKHPMYGKHLTDEHKEKLRLSHIGKKASNDTKRKMSEQRQGNGNGRAQITKDVAKEIIKLLLENKSTMNQIAERLNVSYYTVRSINQGSTWKHLYDVPPREQVNKKEMIKKAQIKVTEEMLGKIRELLMNGMKQVHIAKKIGMSNSSVSRLIKENNLRKVI